MMIRLGKNLLSIQDKISKDANSNFKKHLMKILPSLKKSRMIWIKSRNSRQKTLILKVIWILNNSFIDTNKMTLQPLKKFKSNIGSLETPSDKKYL